MKGNEDGSKQKGKGSLVEKKRKEKGKEMREIEQREGRRGRKMEKRKKKCFSQHFDSRILTVREEKSIDALPAKSGYQNLGVSSNSTR